MYSADISRTNPTAFLFLIDQSTSMGDPWSDGRTKAAAVSDALNRLIAELVTRCSKDDGVRPYFDIGVIGYGDTVGDALPGARPSIFRSITDLAETPLRVEERVRRIPDGAGGLIEAPIKFPVWFDPTANGGTPMCEAVRRAAVEVAQWCEAHPKAFPPTLLHITDGESTDGDPEPIARKVRMMHTDDGEILMFNLHISSAAGAKVIFPSDEAQAPTSDAKRLFRMSSPLPEPMLKAAAGRSYNASPGTRGYGYNADFTDLVSFFEIGTRPANLAR